MLVKTYKKANIQSTLPKWLTPSCISNPSSVLEWGHIMIPALFIRMFTCFSSEKYMQHRMGQVEDLEQKVEVELVTSCQTLKLSVKTNPFMNSSCLPLFMTSAKALMDLVSDRSSFLMTTFSFPVSSRMSSRASSARSRSLHAMMMRAPKTSRS